MHRCFYIFFDGSTIFQNLKGDAWVISNILSNLWEKMNYKDWYCYIFQVPKIDKSNYCTFDCGNIFWQHWGQSTSLRTRKPKFSSRLCCRFMLRLWVSLSPVSSSHFILFIFTMDVLSSTSFKWQEGDHLSLSSAQKGELEFASPCSPSAFH